MTVCVMLLFSCRSCYSGTVCTVWHVYYIYGNFFMHDNMLVLSSFLPSSFLSLLCSPLCCDVCCVLCAVLCCAVCCVL